YLLMADNNYVWGHVTSAILERYSLGTDWARRVGIGLVPALAWLGISVFGLWLIQECTRSRVTPSAEHLNYQGSNKVNYLFLGLMILSMNIFYILGLQHRGHSLWRFVYMFFPGARSI